jgi:hypothetical protein
LEQGKVESNIIFPYKHLKYAFNDKNISLFFIHDYLIPFRFYIHKEMTVLHILEILYGAVSTILSSYPACTTYTCGELSMAIFHSALAIWSGKNQSPIASSRSISSTLPFSRKKTTWKASKIGCFFHRGKPRARVLAVLF